MPTSANHQRDLVKTLPVTGTGSPRHLLAGKGNLLTAARQSLERSARQLRTLLSQAPSLQQTVHDTLQAQLQLVSISAAIANSSVLLHK